MNLGLYILRRLLILIPMIVGITLITFVVSRALPADPIVTNLGQAAQDNPAVVTSYRHRWGLDKPLPTQYLTYVGNLLHGDFGVSLSSQRPVAQDLRAYFPATLELATTAIVLALLIGLPLGVLAASQRQRLADHAARVFSLIGVSTPVFWLGLMALIIFYAKLGWAPGPGELDASLTPPRTITGMMVVDSLLTANWAALRNSLAHLILPALVLALYSMGIITRMARSNLLEILRQDYIRTARAKGVDGRRVVWGHALRNGVGPIITLLGLAYGNLLSGSVLTESIFSWPGIGLYATQTATLLDFPAIMGVALVTASAYLIVNLVVDVVTVILNPQIRV